MTANVTNAWAEYVKTIDEGIKKFVSDGGDIDCALFVLDKLIQENKGSLAEHALVYARGRLSMQGSK